MQSSSPPTAPVATTVFQTLSQVAVFSSTSTRTTTKPSRSTKIDRPVDSQRAELHAAVYALKAFTKMVTKGNIRTVHYIMEVIIKSDSIYLVNGMTKWIIDWRQNGYRNSHRRHLNNQDLFRKLDRLCNNLAEMGVEARFWCVPREGNRLAEKLANAELDGMPRRHLSFNDWFGDDESAPLVVH